MDKPVQINAPMHKQSVGVARVFNWQIRLKRESSHKQSYMGQFATDSVGEGIQSIRRLLKFMDAQRLKVISKQLMVPI